MASDGQPHRIRDKIDNAMLSMRRVFISEDFNPDMARDIIQKLWYLDVTDPGKPILLVINSPGGQTDAGFAIWDQIQMISSPVTTLVTGMAASFGSVISLAAAPGRRFATPHTRIMMHQPLLSGVMKGQATDIEITAREILKSRELLIDIYTKSSGQSREVVGKALDRDTWLSADEALKFGLLDGIVTSFDELKIN